MNKKGQVKQQEKNKKRRLKRSLYGLKQSPRVWFERFGTTVKGLSHNQSQVDHTMFHKHTMNGKVAILIVYVDDINLTGNDDGEIENLKKKLVAVFEIKNLVP